MLMHVDEEANWGSPGLQWPQIDLMWSLGTAPPSWNDNIKLGCETEARDRESKETLDRIHEQQLEQKPRAQGRKKDVRHPASDDGTWHAGVLGGWARDTAGSRSSRATPAYLAHQAETRD